MGKRVEGVIDPESGLTAQFISGDDLMAAKIAAERSQDLAELAASFRPFPEQMTSSDLSTKTIQSRPVGGLGIY
jgi:hypothetical protein